MMLQIDIILNFEATTSNNVVTVILLYGESTKLGTLNNVFIIKKNQNKF